MKKPTSKDVARVAGVSQSTVSFVLNSRADMTIPEHTRQKVLAAVKELNYVPNQFAKGLKTNKSKLLGLLLPTITNPFYPLLTQCIEEYAAAKGYNVLLCNTYRKAENEKEYLNVLIEKAVDGIIYGFTPRYPDLVEEVSSRIPIVIVGEKDDALNINTVALNSFKAGEIVAQHLIELGHKDIAFVTSPLDGMSLSRQKRLNGVISKLTEYKLEHKLILRSDIKEYENSDSTYEIEVGYNLTCEILEKSSPTAIIGVNDMVAFGALNAITKKGLSVPHDISVCGFDNIYLSRVLQPQITTVDHYASYRSKLAVDILLDQISQSHEGVCRVEYDPQLIIRESTGPVRL